MLYAIFSDLHANESAFRHALDDARVAGAEKFVCLGDIVGYGPMPAETLRLVRENCCAVIAGNHDDAVSGRMPADDFIDLAADAVVRHQRALAKDELEWLNNLPYTAEIDGAALVHGDLSDSPAFYYIDSVDAAAQNFTLMPRELLFCGHTHEPRIYVMAPDGDVTAHAATDFALAENFHYIVNPGSVGYPREGNGRCESTYVLYDSAHRTIRYRRLPFAVSSVMQRGKDSPHPGKLRLFAMLAALALVPVIAVPAFLLREPPAAAESAEKALETHDLSIPAMHRKLTPNLQLANGSAPVNLRVTFFAADGRVLFRAEDPVKKSRRSEIRIPADATDVRLELFQAPSEDLPDIHSFAPFTN